MPKYTIWPIEEPRDSRGVIRDHVTHVIVTEENLTPFLGWRCNRDTHTIRKAMHRENVRGRDLVAIVMRIEKMN